MVKLKSDKPRSRRLRKKLHVSEFTENYVQLNFKVRKDSAEMMDIEAWCDLHDLLFDIIIESGGHPASGASHGNEMEVSFTQYANQPDITKAVAELILERTDVYLKQVYASDPVDVWNWWGWDIDDPFDLLYDKSFLVMTAA